MDQNRLSTTNGILGMFDGRDFEALDILFPFVGRWQIERLMKSVISI